MEPRTLGKISCASKYWCSSPSTQNNLWSPVMKLLDFFMFVCKFAPVLTLKIYKDGNEKMNLAILQSDQLH